MTAASAQAATIGCTPPNTAALAPLSDAAAASAQAIGQTNLRKNAATPPRINDAYVRANSTHSTAAIMGAAIVQATKSHAPMSSDPSAAIIGDSKKPTAQIQGTAAPSFLAMGNISEQAD